MLYQVQPFENRMVRLRLTGAQVLETLETSLAGREPDVHVSGIRVEYDRSRPAGSRVISVRLDDGRALESEATYWVAVNDFMAQRGDGYETLGDPLERDDTGMLDIDVLVDYLSAHERPARAPSERRLLPVPGAGR